MNIIINGKQSVVADEATLATALEHFGVPERGVAVAVDGTVVPRMSWSTTPLEPDSAVEILTAVQGG